jgi:catechol 2,3-dioxygenase-like lactoylglutathione lyase family enzyme
VAVPARVSLVTLGVSDVARATAFYTALGWEVSAASAPNVTFLRTAGARLALYGTADLAGEAGLPAPSASGGGFRGVTLSVNVEDEATMDAAIAVVESAGGRVLRAPGRVEWGGWIAYFADPDGHVWEVAHNPGFPLGEDGLPQLP